MIQPNRSSKNHKVYGVFLLGAILSCFIGLYNNYPLVYPDTGSYLHSGWDNVVLYDRPIFYGLFLFESSYGGSPLLMIFAQSLLICYLLYLTIGLFFEGLQKKFFYLGSILFLTLFTGYSYTVSILIPDIFSSIAILCVINLLVNKKISILHHVLIAIIYVFSICTQFSTLPVIAFVFGFVFLFIVWRKIKKTPTLVSFRGFFIAVGLTLSTLYIIPRTHQHYDGYFKISGGNHVFILNHMLEMGILDDYLKNNCPQKGYKICHYKDSLYWDFMWNPESPIFKTGGWEANRQEYKAIIKDIVFTEKYFWMLFRKGIEYSFKQYFTFRTTVSSPQMYNSAPYGQVQWRLPDTKREYEGSMQNKEKYDVSFVNDMEHIIILLSMLILFAVCLTPVLFQKLNSLHRWTTVMLLLYTISSAIMCSNLSTVNPRFQNRIVWLLPLWTAFVLIHYYRLRKAGWNPLNGAIVDESDRL